MSPGSNISNWRGSKKCRGDIAPWLARVVEEIKWQFDGVLRGLDRNGIRMVQQLALGELCDIAPAVHTLAWAVNYSIRRKS